MENSVNRSPRRLPVLHIALLLGLAWFALSPQVWAACQDACLTNANTVQGFNALISLTTTGRGNTAMGFQALRDNTSGEANTATGRSALEQNQNGTRNTAIGYHALDHNTTGIDNIAIGFAAGIGLTTGSHNIAIAAAGQAGESGTMRVGDSPDITRTFIAGIRGVTVNGSPVVVGAGGQLGVVASSQQFKDDIKPMDKASEVILALKPVTFRYKHDLDPAGVSQFGLVAEEVEKVNPDLVARDDHGKPYTVRYDAVNAMLLNEFLKEHREVAELKSIVAEQRKDMQQMAAQLKEQAAQIQKVSAQLELSKAAPQVVNNP
jgi:trimeric autotransporter adhesin